MTLFGGMLALALLLGSALISLALADRRDGAVALWPVGFTLWVSVVLTQLVSVRSGVRLDAAGHLLAPCAGAFFGLFVLVLPVRWRAVGAAVTVTLLAMLGLANVLFFRQFGAALPAEMLGRIHDAWIVRTAVAALLSPGDSWLAVPLVAAGFVVWGRARKIASRTPPAVVLGCAFLAAPAIVAGVQGGLRTTDPGNHPQRALASGYLIAELRDVWAAIAERRELAADPTELEAIRALTSTRGAASAKSERFGLARGASVVIVQVESLSSWLLDARFDGRPVAPTLVSLAAEGVVFPRVLDQTGPGRTSDADHLTLVSQHPLPRAPVAVAALENEVMALPKVLYLSGYATLLVASDPRGLWSIARRAARYGFARAVFQDQLPPGELIGWFHGDRVVLEHAAELAEGLPRPFLLRVSTMSMHRPHHPLPESLDPHALGRFEGTPLGNYLDAVGYFDRALDRFVKRIRARAPDALIVIHGDHIESHGFDRRDVLELSGRDLAEVPTVPLIFLHPKLDPRAPRPATAGLIDVGPSVLDLLGVEAPPSFIGTTLFGAGPALAVRWNGLAITGKQIWDDPRCRDSSTGHELELARCDALRSAARRELSASWFLTRQRQIPDFEN